MTSIRRQLLISLMITLLAASLILGFTTYLNARDEIDEVFDENLEQVALALKSQLPLGNIGVTNQENKTLEEQEFIIQAWDHKNTLVYASHPALALPIQTNSGMATIDFSKKLWRVFVVHTENGTIQAALPLDARMEVIRGIAVRIMIPQFMLIPLLGLCIWLAVGRSLGPLSVVSKSIAKRGPHLLEPVSEKDIPIEIMPLVTALNELLERLGDAFKTQRRFTADAAHELRSPLTAIALQLEMVERAQNVDERTQAISRLKSGIARSIHLVQQLLAMARLEPEAGDRLFTTLHLQDLAKSVIEQFLPQALVKKIDLGMTETHDVTLRGDTDALRVLLGNLIDNAIRYSPADSNVDIKISETDTEVTLAVMDNGPGIPEHELERVFDRFYRLPGSKTTGSGLGLAIVKAIADRHHATIQLLDNLNNHGLEVRVIFKKNINLYFN